MNETIQRFIDAADELLMLQQALIGPHETAPTIEATKIYIETRQALLDSKAGVVALSAAA